MSWDGITTKALSRPLIPSVGRCLVIFLSPATLQRRALLAFYPSPTRGQQGTWGELRILAGGNMSEPGRSQGSLGGNHAESFSLMALFLCVPSLAAALGAGPKSPASALCPESLCAGPGTGEEALHSLGWALPCPSLVPPWSLPGPSPSLPVPPRALPPAFTQICSLRSACPAG